MDEAFSGLVFSSKEPATPCIVLLYHFLSGFPVCASAPSRAQCQSKESLHPQPLAGSLSRKASARHGRCLLWLLLAAWALQPLHGSL